MNQSRSNKQITVIVGVVIKDKKILLTQRDEPECPKAHLKWELPGGKVDFGETTEQALVREFLEETGVKIKVGTLLPFSLTNYWEYKWGTQQTLCFFFACEFVKQLKQTKDHHVHQVAWVELSKLKNLDCLPGTLEAIKAAQSV
jgi:8-oxo-dGTP diphosphatase